MLTCSGLRLTVSQPEGVSESLNKETVVLPVARDRRRSLLHIFTPRKKNLNFRKNLAQQSIKEINCVILLPKIPRTQQGIIT